MKIKRITKTILCVAFTFTLGAAVAFLSCKASGGNAATVFAQTKDVTTQNLDSTKTLEAMQDAFRCVAENILPCVVEVDVTEKKTVQASPFDAFPWFFFGEPDTDTNPKGKQREYEQSGLGSGVIVRRAGDTVYVLTNNHVAGSATKITIELYDSREFEAKLVGADARQDIALVSFETKDKDIKVATLGNSSAVKQGDICFAVGNPLGYFSSITQGIVSATGRTGTQIGNINDFLQTDAAINQGNSGGPLVNIYGEVIGINTWIASNSGGSQGLGFSIPIDNIKTAINDFISKGKISYGWIGVQLVEVTEDTRESLGLEKTQQGAFASEVFLGSPAYKGGIRPGDYITELEGHKVKTVDQLVRDVGSLKVGESAKFTVMRSGKPIEVTIKIEERSEEAAQNSSKLWPGFIALPLTSDIKKQLELDDKVQGILVASVQEKTPAAALRLRNNDIITAVNDKDVKNLKDFYEALDTTKTKEFWFDIYSEGHTITTAHYKIK